MRKTNEELDELITSQQALISDAAGMVDAQRGHVSKKFGQLVSNRKEAIRSLENQKEVTSVKLRAGL
ncbi:hypothetical protein ACFL1R_07360 [Candidatus Latescibacterota bacterium]